MDRKMAAGFVTSLTLREGTGYCSFLTDQLGVFRKQMKWVMFEPGDWGRRAAGNDATDWVCDTAACTSNEASGVFEGNLLPPRETEGTELCDLPWLLLIIEFRAVSVPWQQHSCLSLHCSLVSTRCSLSAVASLSHRSAVWIHLLNSLSFLLSSRSKSLLCGACAEGAVSNELLGREKAK